MTTVVLSPRRPDRATHVVTNPDDRWALPASPIGRFSIGMAAVLVLSLGLHAILVTVAYLNDGTSAAPPQEAIAVEIVQDVPKSPPLALKPALPAPPAPQAKAEAPAPRSEPPKVETAKPEPAKAEPPKSEAKSEPMKQAAPKAPPREAEAQKTLQSLESQFEALKAERDALEAERIAEAQPPAPAAMPRPRAPIGMGPLPDSFQAIALPATSDGVGEAVGYQQIVFSQLAKANEIGKTQGLPGTSGVHFEIDETGKLISAEIAVPSGVPSLDAVALTIVRKAAPFPPPPQGAQRSFDANVNFVVEKAQ